MNRVVRTVASCGLVLLTTLALAEAPDVEPDVAPAAPALTVLLRAGVSRPTYHVASLQNPFRTAPEVELAFVRPVTPWLDAELGAAWTRSTPVAIEGFAVSPWDPNVTVPFKIQPELTEVPISLSLRLKWPQGLRLGAWTIAPALVLGGGAIYGEYSPGTADVPGTAPSLIGWGPEGHAGLGVELHLGEGLALSLDGRCRWARATLRQQSSPQLLLGTRLSSSADLGGASLLAGAGWSF